MADKIAERKRIAAERGYTPKIWQKTSFKRSFKPYTPGSERQLKPRAELFCSWVQSEKNVDPSRLFYHGAKLPELSLIKNFLNFYVSTSTGRIRQKSTIETVQNYCNCVTGYLRREVGCEYSQADQKDLSNYIINELATEFDLGHGNQQKHNADEIDQRVLFERHWRCDVGQTVHRERILQYPLSIQLLYYLLARVGSVLKIQDYKDLGLKYKHLTVMVEWHEGKARRAVQVKQEDMKGKKNSGDYIDIILYEEEEFMFCPILLILAIAFRRCAFRDISSPEELFNLRPESKDDVIRLDWDQDVREERFCDLSDQTLRKWNSEVLIRAGYEKCWRLYSIRYAISNRLGDDPSVSKDRHMQTMGHTHGSVIVKSYQSRLVQVDVQGLVRRKKQDESIDYSKYLRVQRGCPPPDGIPYQQQKEIEKQVSQAGLNGQDKYNLRRKLQIQARKAFIENWHKESHQKESPVLPSANIPDSVELLGDLSKSDVQLKVKQRFSLTHQIIMDACDKENLNLQDRVALVRFLRDLPDDGAQNYYPDELPIRTEISTGAQLHCPFCMKDITDQTATWRPKHIHDCARTHLWVEKEEPRYCYRCNIWFPSMQDYRAHCKLHWDEIDMFCGLLYHRQIVYISGRCPFCMADEELPWEERMFEFDVPSTFSTHMEGHFKNIGENPSPCPHPRCTKIKYQPAELKEHLEEGHSLKHTSSNPRGRPRQPLRHSLGTALSKVETDLAGACEIFLESDMEPTTQIVQEQSTINFPSNEHYINDVDEHSITGAIHFPPITQPIEELPDRTSSDSPTSASSSTVVSRFESSPCTTPGSTEASSCTTPSSTGTVPSSDGATPTSTGTGIITPTGHTELGPPISSNPPGHVTANYRRVSRYLPTRDTPPVTRQRRTETGKKKYTTGVKDVMIEGVACHSNICEIGSQPDDQAESSPTDYTSLSTALPPGLGLVGKVSRKPCSPRRQPSQATPMLTRRRARLEVESRCLKRRRT